MFFEQLETAAKSGLKVRLIILPEDVFSGGEQAVHLRIPFGYKLDDQFLANRLEKLGNFFKRRVVADGDVMNERQGQNDVCMAPSTCLLYTSPSPRDQRGSRMPSSA